MSRTVPVRSETVDQLEKLLDDIAEKLRQQYRGFRPMYPWIFIRTLQREQQQGSIVLPEISQNKTIHEGIVVATWSPFTQEKGTVDKNGKKLNRVIEKRSAFELGDHVLYAHWAGLPVRGYPEDQYRMIKEDGYEHSGGAYALVEYSEVHVKAGAKLRNMLEQALNDVSVPEMASIIAAKIEEQFLLVDRDAQSVTISGR